MSTNGVGMGYSTEESELVAFAKDELRRTGLFDGDSDFDGMIGKSVLEIVEVFDKQRHSGVSASITVSLISMLLQHIPLTPLTYGEDEWVDRSDISSTPLWQNKRNPKIFSEDHGVTWYDLDGNRGSCSVEPAEEAAEPAKDEDPEE